MEWTRTFVIAVLIAYPAAARTTTAFCGAIVDTNLQLESDLVCPGDGVIVGADDIRIDLNGHSISGSGVGVGILISGRRDVSILGGEIGGFATGVRMLASTGVVIRRTAFAGNAEGIDLQAGSVGNTVKENRFANSTIRAMMLRTGAMDNDIKGNVFTGNRVGILVFGGVDNRVKDNDIVDSSLAGVRFNVIATGNVLKDNRIGANAAGVEFLVTPTGSAVGNEVKDNTLSGNGCGIKGPSAGNTIRENRFDGNTADSCS